ncbi:hypothetical protein Tco_1213897 [Tanacetum coccineum]
MDLIIPIGQKNTLAEYIILFGADNRPLMLDKDLYDSWKSRMELYMQNRENGRMILKSVEHGLLIWPTIEENRVTRTKKYVELVAKDLWEKVQLLMQGTSLTKQERECKLYDAFDKFTHIKRESLALVANHQMTPSHLNTYQSSYNNPQFQQQEQFSPSQSPQYGSNHSTQHYSSTYPSTPHATTYPSTPYPNAYSSTVHQEAYP